VRDFSAHSEGLGAQKQFGAAGLRVAGRLFGAWREFRRDADRARLLESVAPLQEELRALPRGGGAQERPQPPPPQLRQEPAQALAGAVELRRRAIERLLSASITCRLQGRSLFAYLSDVLAAKIRDNPIPLLT
jgi:hypothetical protein